MKKIRTESWLVWIIETNKDKFIRQYKRDNKSFHGYPRTIPTNKIMEILNKTYIKVPKLLRNRIKYIDEEFIESTYSIKEYDRIKIINEIINYENILYSLDDKNLKKYIKWNDNQGFYNFLVNHLSNNLDKLNSRTIYILNQLGIREKCFDDLKKQKIDSNRKMCFIHGDIKYDNMIIRNDEIYLIDWELATIGDIAYELATHFLLMDYTQKEQEYFIKNYTKDKNINIELLKKDIKVYMDFELIRRCYLKLNQFLNNNNHNYLNDFFVNYSNLCNRIKLKKYNKEEIKKIINSN